MSKVAKTIEDMDKRPTVCVDFDGVLHRWGSHGWKGPCHFNDPFDGGIRLLEVLHDAGYHILIYTCRTNPDLFGPSDTLEGVAAAITTFLVNHGAKREWFEVYVNPGKPLASAYIDDRSVYCNPYKDGNDAFFGAYLSCRDRVGS